MGKLGQAINPQFNPNPSVNLGSQPEGLGQAQMVTGLTSEPVSISSTREKVDVSKARRSMRIPYTTPFARELAYAQSGAGRYRAGDQIPVKDVLLAALSIGLGSALATSPGQLVAPHLSSLMAKLSKLPFSAPWHEFEMDGKILKLPWSWMNEITKTWRLANDIAKVYSPLWGDVCTTSEDGSLIQHNGKTNFEDMSYPEQVKMVAVVWKAALDTGCNVYVSAETHTPTEFLERAINGGYAYSNTDLRLMGNRLYELWDVAQGSSIAKELGINNMIMDARINGESLGTSGSSVIPEDKESAERLKSWYAEYLLAEPPRMVMTRMQFTFWICNVLKQRDGMAISYDRDEVRQTAKRGMDDWKWFLGNTLCAVGIGVLAGTAVFWALPVGATMGLTMAVTAGLNVAALTHTLGGFARDFVVAPEEQKTMVTLCDFGVSLLLAGLGYQALKYQMLNLTKMPLGPSVATNFGRFGVFAAETTRQVVKSMFTHKLPIVLGRLSYVGGASVTKVAVDVLGDAFSRVLFTDFPIDTSAQISESMSGSLERVTQSRVGTSVDLLRQVSSEALKAGLNPADRSRVMLLPSVQSLPGLDAATLPNLLKFCGALGDALKEKFTPVTADADAPLASVGSFVSKGRRIDVIPKRGESAAHALARVRSRHV